MTARRADWLVPIAFAASGATIGAMVVFLFSHGWTAAWVETAGTWVGAVGTILTLVWAVHVFRRDQERHSNLQAESLRANAAMVDVTAKTGAADVIDGDLYLNYMILTIFNDSSSPIRVRRFTCPGVTLGTELSLPIRLSRGSSVAGTRHRGPTPV